MSLLSRLKSSSSTIHAKLHRLPQLRQLFSKNLSLSSYVKILQAYEAFFVPLEERVIDLLGNQMPRHYCLRSQWLRQDFQYLNTKPLQITHRDFAPQCLTFVQALGILYVLEGSSKGGEVVSKQLRESLGLNELRGARFFTGYGADSTEVWNKLCIFFDEFTFSEAAENELLGAVLETMTCFHDWLLEFPGNGP